MLLYSSLLLESYNKSFGVKILTVILAEREENFGNKEVGFGCVQEQTA